MLSNLTAKLALKKVGLDSNTLDNIATSVTAAAPAWLTGAGPASPTTERPAPGKRNGTRTTSAPAGSLPGLDEDGTRTGTGGGTDSNGTNWPSWMSVKALPLTVQPWFSPPPPPIPVAPECPRVGDVAPMDRDRKITVGGGKKVVVVFLRCVGCAFAQKQFLALRALSTKYAGQVTCIAVSHSSPRATQKWFDLLGGSWSVQVVIDEDRAVYAAWGLGLGSVWSVLNPATQVQSWKEKGWLGGEVAGALGRTWVGGGIGGTNASSTGGRYAMSARTGADGGMGAGSRKNSTVGDGEAEPEIGSKSARPITTGGTGVIDAVRDPTEGGPSTVMGNKWQESGAWAVDGNGKIVWGMKARSADMVLDLEAGAQALGLKPPSS